MGTRASSQRISDCSPKQLNARVAVVMAFHPGCASRELALKAFRPFFDFLSPCWTSSNVRIGIGLQQCALERSSSQRRSGLFAQAAQCLPPGRYVVFVIALHPGCASRELALSLFDHFLTFAVLNVEKRLKWYTRMLTRASAESEEKWNSNSNFYYPKWHNSQCCGVLFDLWGLDT